MNDEKTIYDDEKTQYLNRDDDATLYDNSYEASETTYNSVHSKQQKKPQKSMWKKAAAGAGTGIVLGAATTLLREGERT